MADEKSCENCSEFVNDSICGASTSCLMHNFNFWKPKLQTPPTKPESKEEMIEFVVIRCPQYHQNENGLCEYSSDCRNGETCDEDGNIDIKISQFQLRSLGYIHKSKILDNESIKPRRNE